MKKKTITRITGMIFITLAASITISSCLRSDFTPVRNNHFAGEWTLTDLKLVEAGDDSLPNFERAARKGDLHFMLKANGELAAGRQIAGNWTAIENRLVLNIDGEESLDLNVIKSEPSFMILKHNSSPVDGDKRASVYFSFAR